MQTFVITLMLSLVIAASCRAQEEKSAEARRLAMEGIHKTDAGDLDAGLELLVKAAQLDPDEPNYSYEQAYVHYKKKNYTKVVELVEKILESPRAIDRWYELLGNAYDELGQAEKSVETYQQGLKRFPGSGTLHLELGIMAAKKNDFNGAAKYWEEGIERDPAFPSNYYWAAKAYCGSSERIWGLIYGEIFMNLEPDSKRTREISAMLFDTYRRSIVRHGDTLRVDVGRAAMMTPPRKGEKTGLPFTLVYTTDLSLASVGLFDRHSDSVTIRSLNTLRRSFIENWRKQKHDAQYPVVLFDRQSALIAAGEFEAYNYWLFSGGTSESRIWADTHREALTSFITWLGENPMHVDSSNVFYRTKVEP